MGKSLNKQQADKLALPVRSFGVGGRLSACRGYGFWLFTLNTPGGWGVRVLVIVDIHG